MKMRNILSVLIILLFGSAGLMLAQAKSPVEDAFIHFDKMMSTIQVGKVIGKPIRVQDTLIIPFSKISFGLGAGGMMMGYGGGMGGKTVPLGILIIEGEDIRVELFPLEEKQPSFFEKMLPYLLQMLPQVMGKKFPPSAPSPQEKAPEEPYEPSGEGTLSQVQKLFEGKKYPEALKMVESLIAKDPKNPDLYAWKGNVMGSMAQGNPIDMMKYGMGAMQAFEKALELDPDHAMAHFGRGMGRLMAPEGFGGDLDGAIEDFEFACRKESFPEAFYHLGVAYNRKGLPDKAKEAFKKALELKPDYKEAAKALAELG